MTLQRTSRKTLQIGICGLMSTSSIPIFGNDTNIWEGFQNMRMVPSLIRALLKVKQQWSNTLIVNRGRCFSKLPWTRKANEMMVMFTITDWFRCVEADDVIWMNGRSRKRKSLLYYSIIIKVRELVIVCQSGLWADLGLPGVRVCLCVCLDRNRTLDLLVRF